MSWHCVLDSQARVSRKIVIRCGNSSRNDFQRLSSTFAWTSNCPWPQCRRAPAIVLVVGTGSAAIGRDATGSIKREGGFGPAVSDEGSAFDIGRSASVAAREGNCGGASDQLTRQIFPHLGVKNWTELDLKSAANADAVYPRVFPVVAAAADAGNAVAQSILRRAAEKLAAISYRLAQSLKLLQEPFPVGKTGGAIGRSRFFDRAIDNALRATLRNAIITPLQVQPAEVAAWIALQLYRNRAGAAP